MAAYHIIQKLAATPGKLDKEQIVINAFMTGEREFFIGANLAYNALITFGVKKVPSIAEEDINDDPGTFAFQDFIALTDKLRARTLTGNAMQEALRDAAQACHSPTWNDFYRRVLQKDFDCGATESTINKALANLAKSEPEAKKLMIEVFECQLAENGKDAVHAKKIVGVKMIDQKLDGGRLLAVLDKEAGAATLYTRNGLIVDNFIELSAMLEKLMHALPLSVVLDGETVAENFQELMTKFRRKTKVDTSNIKLALFDMIPLADFRKKHCSTPQSDRHAALCDLEMGGLLRGIAGDSIYVIPKLIIDLDTPEGKKQFIEFNNAALAAGFEGVMIKDPAAPYRCKRNAAWIKIKPKISLTMEVLAVEQGSPDGKRRNVMGALMGRCIENGEPVEANCGGGFSDVQLADFWERRESLIGMLFECEGDTLTRDRKTGILSVRFPVFKGWRGTVPGELI